LDAAGIARTEPETIAIDPPPPADPEDPADPGPPAETGPPADPAES
jgi:hypothetical protein